MAEMLLINPRKRRKVARKKTARRASPARKRRVVRRANPINSVRRVVRRRRSNPIKAARRVTRRRRNPISLGGSKINVKSIMAMVKDAAIGGAGAVGVDVLFGKLNPHLPASIQLSPTKVGAGDAVKALFTVVVGKLLSKPTRGLSVKMAQGALTTQARDLISGLLPASVQVAGMGYASPAAITRGSQRVGPFNSQRSVPSLAAYTRPGSGTPMLNQYQRPGGGTPLLSRFTSARQREGSIR